MVITELPALVDALPTQARVLFDRIYRVASADGRLRAPTEMVPWIERTFGALADVETQRIVRVSNVVTGEGTLFNELRARRPVRGGMRDADDMAAQLRDDPWAEPLKGTPEDLFGRRSNAYGLTAANVAKYDAAHSIVMFTEPDPLAFTRESVIGQFELAGEWLRAAHEEDPEARYPYVMWNCLWRAGGSIVHGHAQMSLARDRHYAKIERLRSDAERYRATYGSSYFDDFIATHEALGLAHRVGGVSVLAHLTPLKEKECVVIGDAFDAGFAGAVHGVLASFRDSLSVRSFNVGVLMPPPAESTESWAGFPLVARIVDRGSLDTRTSDFGGMELFAESVVAADPFAVHQALVEVSG